MRFKHIEAAIKDAIACALVGQFDTAHALIDHAEELARVEPADKSKAMEFMDGYEKTAYTAHLTEFSA